MSFPAVLPLAALAALAGPASGADISAVPHDAAIERQFDGENWLVLRYLAPQIAGGAVDYAEAAPALEALCVTDGLPRAAAAEEPVAQVLIVLMDRPVPRGVADPEAAQMIGAFRIEGGACRWE